MELSPHEEKVLISIQRLGPDHICNQLFKDDKSRAAIASLIGKRLIKPDFTAKDEAVDEFRRSGILNHDDFYLRFRLTDLGHECAENIYIPNPLYGGRMFVAAVLLMLAVMAGIALWLI